MDDGTTGLTPTRALQQLEESRSFLQRLIVAASAIEGLKRGVEDMLAQGEPAADNDPNMTRFIEGLGRKVRNLSDAEVTVRLEKLDRRLQGLFARMMPLIEGISAGETTLEDRALAEASNDIDALKRLARTSLAIRGMLARRGLAIPDFRLPLDRAQLQRKLFAIAREEQQARREVIQQVRSMGNDIRKLLERVDLPSAMRQLLDQMQAGLLANLEHLRAGNSVAELPLPIETASFIEPLPANSSGGSATPDEPAGSVGESPDFSASDDSAREENRRPKHLKDGVRGSPKRPSFLRAVWLWIRSPWEVSWRDIRQGRYRG